MCETVPDRDVFMNASFFRFVLLFETEKEQTKSVTAKNGMSARPAGGERDGPDKSFDVMTCKTTGKVGPETMIERLFFPKYRLERISVFVSYR